MKHNTLLLLIFIPILVYQLYHTFRYWKEGLEPSTRPPPPPSGPRWEIWKDLPDFCKGKDYGVVGEKWNKKTEESKCKWKGVPEDDKTHCIYKQREWCEKDCKGKFDHKGHGAWCKDVAQGGKDTLRVPDSGAPFCDSAFMENLDKHCPVLDGGVCNCWEKIKFNKAVCELPADAQEILGGSSGSIVFKMHCTKGFTKDEYIRFVMSEGGKSEDAEMSWEELSKDGYFSAESIRHYTMRLMEEAERKLRDDAERKRAGIGPNPKDKLEAELPTDDPGLSSKAYAIATKTRKQALASGKTVAEAEGDGQRAAAKISDGGTSKDRVQEVIKNIAGGGGSLAVQAIGSQLAKLESDKKAAEAAMAEIPNSRTPAVRGDTASGSLGAAPTPSTGVPRTAPQASSPLGSNETYSIANKPDSRISWPGKSPSNIKENSNCAAFCGYKTPFCEDIVNKSTQCQSVINGKKGCDKFNKDAGGNKCRWQEKKYRPCTKQCKEWGCANCTNLPSPPPPPPSGGNSQECTLCRTRGSTSSWCIKCKETCKKNNKYWNGKDCMKIGGCKSTQYGCCPDGKTAKKDLTGFNCHGPPSGKPIEGRFKAWIDGQGGSSFEANTTEPPNAGVVPGTNMAPDIPSLLAAHEKQFHPSNNSSKQSDLKGTSLKKVNSEVNKNGWCIPQKNTQGKILSWIAKPINTPGWSKTDKCLTIDGKEIIFGTGSCLQGQTEDECNLGLVKLQKDKYWHTHPVLLRKIKENGPTPTPLGSKYV